ncbi:MULTISPECIES: halocin C8-like domain-containing protein [unclassified Haloferax]|uniref:halocin C8-like domain-containing protein n=1 Tax=Haloferax TaxID=2251 RepID=UPI0002B13D07|nr:MULTISPECIES: halocin C8-like domain-containing protein [unclassified Haloferax]ELZ59055.1 halocin C8 (TBD) [Haloferax sp. ATCC BAA-646]ELZ60346.1 halocin C8 (TBD) [Haloferax sp. ATCC BAA-645]ELZ72344.1 halocin C8 (TBD) [Haloferax sp. ATCC BAA-644]
MTRANDNEHDSNEQETSGLNRRSFVRRAGAVGTGLALSPVAAGNAVAAENISILDGKAEAKVATRLAKSDEFDRLEAKAKSRDGTVSRGESVTVGEVEVAADDAPDGEKIHRYVVEYPVKHPNDDAEAAVVLAEDATSGSLILSVLDYTHKTKDGFTTRIERFDAGAGEQTVSAANNSDGLVATELDLDADATRRAVNNVDTNAVIDEIYDGFTTGSDLTNLAWDLLDDDVDVDGCYACGFAVGLTCSVGCAATGAFICGLTGIAVPIAGLTCVGFVGIICDVADALSGCGEAVAEEVCADRTNWC